MSTGTTTGGTTPATPTPTPGVTPAKTTIPQKFATEAAKAEMFLSEIQLHLQSFSLPFLKNLEAKLAAALPLPNGLDTYRQYIDSFLQDAIAAATDFVTAAQLLSQLSTISATGIAAPQS